jgi:NADPH:quinone reductase-like Zn-dependent oxidoreductase
MSHPCTAISTAATPAARDKGITRSAIATHDFVTKNVTLHGIETGSRDMFDEMTRFIDQYDIKPVIDSTFPRSEIATALTRLQHGGHFGKIVITG